MLFRTFYPIRSEPHKLRLVKSDVGQELAIDVLRMQWRNVSGDDPPKSVCSEPCPMGHVRSYAVSIQTYRPKLPILWQVYPREN